MRRWISRLRVPQLAVSACGDVGGIGFRDTDNGRAYRLATGGNLVRTARTNQYDHQHRNVKAEDTPESDLLQRVRDVITAPEKHRPTARHGGQDAPACFRDQPQDE